MTSLLAQPYSKLDQDRVDTKIPEDIVDGGNGPENVDNSDTRAEGNGTPAGSNWQKRYKDLQAFHDREVAKMKQELAAAQTEKFELPTTPEKLEEFRGKHPELFNIIKAVAMQEGKQVGDRIRTDVDGLRQSVTKSQAQLLREQIKDVHPDFTTIVASEEFNSWVDGKSVTIQGWVRNNPDNAELAIAALDMYKAETGYSSERKAAKKESTPSADAAQAIKTGGSPQIKSEKKIWKASEVAALHPKEFAKYEAEIDLAMEEDRIDFNS